MTAFDTLIRSLQDPALYGPAVRKVDVLETHISCVFLTGDFAYKIKKPLDLGFLDFSTLEKRRFFCQEELRLNRRLAPDLYLDVVAITGTPDHPVLNGDGPPIEFAVRMRQFSQDALLDKLESEGKLKASHIDQIAAMVAAFHATIPWAPKPSPFGSLQNVRQPAIQNFDQIRPLLRKQEDLALLNALQAWSEKEYQAREADLARRKQAGFIRECHGDMHLGNMALIDNSVTIFDCIEFNDNLRWIDVMSETAFLFMDLVHRNQQGLAYRFLNVYLEITGDYTGTSVLRSYLVYRAMVRAKVTCIRASQPGLDQEQKSLIIEQYQSYSRLAQYFTAPPKPALIITHGLSGSGKTTLTQSLLEDLGAIRVRSDIERKRLFNLPSLAKSASGIDSGIYSQEAGDRTYGHLADIARNLLQAGYPAIMDATFLKLSDRTKFRALAEELHVPFIILDFKAENAILRERVKRREERGTDASEAGLAVLEHQLATHQAITQEEMPFVIDVDATLASIPESTLARIKTGLR